MLIAVRGIQPGKRDPVQPPCGRCRGVRVRLQVSGPYEILQATVEIMGGSVHPEGLCTLRRYGTSWYSALALKRWGRLDAEDLHRARLVGRGLRIKDG